MLPPSHKYDFGEAVRVLRNIRDDGTFPGASRGELLVRRGNVGFIREIGTFLQDQVVYSVHFLDSDRVVGCRETEIQGADDPWVPSLFETRERVSAKIKLAINGEVRVNVGTVGSVVKVLRDDPQAVAYHVHFPGGVLQVPESALELASLSADDFDEGEGEEDEE